MDPKSKIVKSKATESDRVAAMKTAQSDATGLKDGSSEQQQQQLSAFLKVLFFNLYGNDFHLKRRWHISTTPEVPTKPLFKLRVSKFQKQIFLFSFEPKSK